MVNESLETLMPEQKQYYNYATLKRDVLNVVCEYKPVAIEVSTTLVPLIIDNIIFYSSSFADGIIIGRLGSRVLAASSFISNIKQFTVLSFAATFIALEPLIPEKIAAGDNNDVNRIIYSSVFLSVIYASFSIPLLLVSPYFLQLAGEPDTDLVSTYFDYFVIGVLPIYLVAVVNQFLLSTGWAAKMVPLSLFRTLFEIGLSYSLVNYQGMGVQGWGIATAVQPCVTLLVVLIISTLSKTVNNHIRQYGLQNFPKYDSAFQQITKNILFIGLPACLQTMFAIGVGLVSVFFAATLGTTAVASYQIGSSVSYWAIMFLDPLAALLSVLLANSRNDFNAQSKILKFTSLLYGLSSTLLMLLPSVLSEQIVDLYVPKSDINYIEIKKTCKILIPIMALTAPIYGLKSIFTGILRSEKITLAPMLFEFFGTFLISIALSAVSAFAIKKDVTFIAGSQIIGMLMTTILLGVYSNKISQHKSCFFGSQSYKIFNSTDNINTEESTHQALTECVNNEQINPIFNEENDDEEKIILTTISTTNP